jgi:hypothetical protein
MLILLSYMILLKSQSVTDLQKLTLKNNFCSPDYRGTICPAGHVFMPKVSKNCMLRPKLMN